MERKNTPDIRWWRKLGGGSFHYTDHTGKRRIAKENQKFQARVEDIPEAFMDMVKPADGQPLPPSREEATKPAEVTPTKYTLHHAEGGWYDIHDGEGKSVNENKLRQQAAQSMLRQLQQ